MMALVFFVMARSIKAGSILRDMGSLSTSFIVAPVYSTAFAVAIMVKAGKMTSSPGPMPSAAITRCSATVPLAHATACSQPA